MATGFDLTVGLAAGQALRGEVSSMYQTGDSSLHSSPYGFGGVAGASSRLILLHLALALRHGERNAQAAMNKQAQIPTNPNPSLAVGVSSGFIPSKNIQAAAPAKNNAAPLHQTTISTKKSNRSRFES